MTPCGSGGGLPNAAPRITGGAVNALYQHQLALYQHQLALYQHQLALYQHQLDGARWLAERPTGRGYLADVPGLGKTRTALEAVVQSHAGHVLVVCPAIVRTHWGREAVALCYGDYGTGVSITVKSYDEIVRGGTALMKRLIGTEGVDTLILDEAHYCKNATSQRAVRLLGRNGYARRMQRVYLLSGTPIPKNPLEFWTVLASCFPEVALEFGLKTEADFTGRYVMFGNGRLIGGKWVQKPLATVRNPEEFRALLDKVMLRRTLDDVGLDVPALDWQIVRLDGEQDVHLNHFGGIVNTAIDNGALEVIATDPHVASMRRRLGELKAKPVVDMLTQQLADSDEKVVVFAYHRSVLDELRNALTKVCIGVAYVDGDTSQRGRDNAIDYFQDDPQCRVFLGQNIACQTGITLTAARRVVLVEPEWTKDVNLQLGKRVARIGQRAERCVVQMIALAGTLDEAIVAQNHREASMAETLGLGET